MSFQDYVDELDKKNGYPDRKRVALIGAAAVLALGLVFVCVSYAFSSNVSSVEVVETAEQDSGQESSDDIASDQQPRICVYVTGHVVSPKVVYLDEGSRVADAIEACGGMTESACASALNLARVVQDGEQIVVPSEEELASSNLLAGEAASTQSQDALSSGVSSVSGGIGLSSGKVNINTADVSQLQTLNGIGESKAKKIVDYREKNGSFKTIEDLANVSGIGEKTVENLRESICV